MRVHSIDLSPELAARMADAIGVVDDAARPSAAVAVVSSLPDVASELRAAATKAATGGSYEPELVAIEARHFDLVRRVVALRRQSEVLASIRQQVNLLEDLLGGIALIREASPRTLDTVTVHGEWLSAYVFCECLRERKPDVRFVDTRQVLVTDASFGQAKARFDESRARIGRLFDVGPLGTVVTASIGATRDGDATTFGRGGSRYAGSALAAMLGAEELVVWTDTDGIMTADPRKVPAARTIDSMGYVEAMEMMHFGGDFLYPPALIPAVTHDIPIRVLNAFRPAHAGTLIRRRPGCARAVTGISSVGGIALLQIQGSGMVGVTGVAMRLFAALAGADVNIVLISQASSEHSICTGIREADAARALEAVERAFRADRDQQLVDEVGAETGLVILAVVGERMTSAPGLTATIFNTLGASRVNVKAIAQGASERNVSIVIRAEDERRALNALHAALFDAGGHTE